MFFVLVLLLCLPFTANSSAFNRNPLWQTISTSRIIVASGYGLESIGTNMSNGTMRHVAAVRGSGFVPVELEIVSGRYALVLTEKTLDMYTINGDSLNFTSSVELSRKWPNDITFKDTNKLMVVYDYAFEMFQVSFKNASVSLIDGGLVDLIEDKK